VTAAAAPASGTGARTLPAVAPAAVGATVQLVNGELTLDGFRERSADVIALAREAEDLEALAHDCIEVGARALRAAHATSDVAIVESAFAELSEQFSRGMTGFANELDERARALVGRDGGELSQWMGQWRIEVERVLEQTFDPDSRSSALAKLELIMERAAAAQLREMRALVDADNEQSPLGRYRSEIIRAIEREGAVMRTAVGDLRSEVAANGGRAEALERSAVKGLSFEATLERALLAITSVQEDVCEHIGGSPGASGKAGDFLVSVSPVDCAGQAACYVVEAKDRVLKLGAILKELDDAVVNRSAGAALAVFAREAQAPGGDPFQCYGSRAIVVFDKDDQEPLALRLGCAWARWTVRRQLAAPSESIDLERIGVLIDSARQALRSSTTISTALKASKTKIDHALGHVDALVRDVEMALASIASEVAA
jgi:hypothetical protein